MSENIVDPIGRELAAVPCPLCGLEHPVPLLPSAKLNLKDTQAWARHEHIHLALCQGCGLVFESPQIVIENSSAYAEDFYYNVRNPVSGHDDIQHRWAAYNWHALKNALPWSQFKSVMDVGAAGAWSQWIMDHVPNVDRAVLAEPSPQGTFNCELRYPGVTGELGVFEDFDGPDGSFDLITFHNSFYAVTHPRQALQKMHRLLSEGGHAVIAFSYAGMKLDFWQGGEAGITLSHIVRGVPLIYYTPNTARKMVESCGFETVNEVVFQMPEWDALDAGGRQLYYLVLRKVAEPRELTERELDDLDEREFARRFYRRYCEDITERSLELFVEQLDGKERERATKAPGLVLLHDGDEFYANWAAGRLRAHGLECTLLDGADGNPQRIASQLDDSEGALVMTAGDMRELDLPQLRRELQHARVVDGAPVASYHVYGNWFEMPDGATIIARPLAPVRDRAHRLFPYERLSCLNDTNVTASGMGYAVEDRVSLPQWVYETIPRLAGRIGQAALALEGEDRRALLGPFLECARGPIEETSILTSARGVAPADLRLPDMEGVCAASRLSALRPLVQWALLRASEPQLSGLLDHARAAGIQVPDQLSAPETRIAV